MSEIVHSTTPRPLPEQTRVPFVAIVSGPDYSGKRTLLTDLEYGKLKHLKGFRLADDQHDDYGYGVSRFQNDRLIMPYITVPAPDKYKAEDKFKDSDNMSEQDDELLRIGIESEIMQRIQDAFPLGYQLLELLRRDAEFDSGIIIPRPVIISGKGPFIETIRKVHHDPRSDYDAKDLRADTDYSKAWLKNRVQLLAIATHTETTFHRGMSNKKSLQLAEEEAKKIEDSHAGLLPNESIVTLNGDRDQRRDTLLAVIASRLQRTI